MLRTVFGWVLIVGLFPAAIGAQPPTIHDSAEKRLRYMESTGKTYTVKVGEAGSRRPIRFRPSPVLRFSNAVSGVVDGGLFLWEDQSGRPVAAAQNFIVPNSVDGWMHEFQSLSTEPLVFEFKGKTVWSPEKGGIEFRSFSGAPAPAETAAARLLQMRRLAGQLQVGDAFEGDDEDRLRLLSTPIARYRDAATADGAVFVFAHGTDPELFVILEARPGKADGGEMRWEVAFAPMTAYALKVSLRGQPFWQVEERSAPFPLTSTFINFMFPPN